MLSLLLLVHRAWLQSLVVLLGSLLLCALLGCSPAPESAAPVPGGVLRERFPEQAAEVLGAGAGFLATKEGFLASAQPREGRFVPAAEALETVLPARGDQAVVFRGLTSGFSVRVRELEASGDALREGNAITYARPGGRSYWTAGPDGGAEEWLLLEKEQVKAGEPVAAWEVEGAGLQQRGDAVEVQDPSGKTRLEVTAPRAYAEGGRVIEARLTASGSRLELWVEASGEAVLVDPAWVPTGMLNTPRILHTATQLPNGKVLVAGGSDYTGGNGITLASAELYDPATGVWTSIAAMNMPRTRHTATLLPNGKVLITGGTGVASAEIFDPDTGSWEYTGDMTYDRAGHTATLLPNGTVLIAGGGYGLGQGRASAEIFDWNMESWVSPSPDPMHVVRVKHTATLLPNGKVLITGGYGSGTTASAEIFDPDTGSWEYTGSMSVGRSYHTATLLPNGKVLMTAGEGNGYTPIASAEIFDPETEGWVFAGPISVARSRHSATLLPNGKVLVAGGYTTSSDLFDPATNTWTTTSSTRDLHTECTATLLTNGEILLVGSDSGRHTELYVPTTATGSWLPAATMTSGRLEPTATLLPDGKVLVIGGAQGFAPVELYDPATDSWTATSPTIEDRYYHTATLLPDGKVLVIGGADKPFPSATLDSAEIFDPVTEIWVPTNPMNVGRFYHTATVLPDGKVLVAGGSERRGGMPVYAPFDSAEIFDPVTGSWVLTVPMNGVHSSHTATLLPDGRVLILGGNFAASPSAEIFDPEAGTWALTTPMNERSGCHTATLLPDGKVLLTGGKPSVYGGVAGATSSFERAEIFDPAAESLTLVTPMNVARVFHAAALLPNGKVLVTGGQDNDGQLLASAEIFDPELNSWAYVDAMSSSRILFTATLLPNGRVLAAGGSGGSYLQPGVPTAEIFDPGGRWAGSAPLDTGRVHHTTTALSSAEVLVAGGESGADPLATAQRFVHADNTWIPANAMNDARTSHAATALNGEVLVTGGVGADGYLDSAERYMADTWTLTGTPMVTARAFHTATRLPDGHVLVAGGVGASGTLAAAELYDPVNDTWSPAPPMIDARWRHTATLVEVMGVDMVLVTAGFDDSGAIAGAELYNPASGGAWISAGTIGIPRADHTATLLENGRVLVAGGVNGDGPLNQAALFDPLTMTWTLAPPMLDARSAHTSERLSNGRVLVAGGLGGDGPIDHAEVYDAGSNTWRPVRSLRLGRRGHTGTALAGGQMVVIGGVGLQGLPLASAEMFSLLPNAELCDQPSDCQSDFCVDAVCCNAACANGPCDVCSVRTVITPLGGLTAGVCQPANAVDLPCDDGKACTQTDVCQEKTCVGANPVECPVSNGCHDAGQCNDTTGICSPETEKAPGATCDDSDLCTTMDECNDAMCIGTQPKVCDPPDQCHDPGSCDPTTGECVYLAKEDDAKCDFDDDLCTEDDHCEMGVCVAGTPKECASYACDKDTGRCREPCQSVDDCAAGKVCDRTGQCVDPPPQRSSLDDSGCTLAPKGAEGRAPWHAMALSLLALGALATRRRGGKSIFTEND